MRRQVERSKVGGRHRGVILAAALSTAGLAACCSPLFAQAPAQGVTLLVYDASGSMWGELPGGATKVEVAREVIGDFFQSRDHTSPLGVVAYGHNRRGDCNDIEVIAPVAVHDAGTLTARLKQINPVGMTPLTDALARAATLIPATAEAADIILVTDGLETCDADPCALAARLAAEGIRIRAHVVGFGLTEAEAEVMSCVADATGGLLLTPQSGQELADALNRIAQIEPAAAPVVETAFFHIGPHAEAGHTYAIAYDGTVPPDYRTGFTPRGGNGPTSGPSFGVVGGSGDAGSNPVSRAAPAEPGDYDLIMVAHDGSIIARQAITVVPAANGFDAVGPVEPGARFTITWRGPDQLSQRVVIARPADPLGTYHASWGYSLHKGGTMRLNAPAEAGIYELRYLSASEKEILFSRRFGVGVPFEDDDGSSSADLAGQAAAATQVDAGNAALLPVKATFRIPDGFPKSPMWWSAVPLDSGMSPEAWAPVSETVIAEGEFEPGRYEVSAVAPGEVEFKAVVDIRPGADNDFVIPLAQTQSQGDADGFAEPPVIVCTDQARGCPYSDPATGLSLTVPDGWSLTAPWFYQTAAGELATIPSASLFRQVGGDVQTIELNPRQWLQSNGPCIDLGRIQVCHPHASDVSLDDAIATLRASLTLAD